MTCPEWADLQVWEFIKFVSLKCLRAMILVNTKTQHRSQGANCGRAEAGSHSSWRWPCVGVGVVFASLWPWVFIRMSWKPLQEHKTADVVKISHFKDSSTIKTKAFKINLKTNWISRFYNFLSSVLLHLVRTQIDFFFFEQSRFYSNTFFWGQGKADKDKWYVCKIQAQWSWVKSPRVHCCLAMLLRPFLLLGFLVYKLGAQASSRLVLSLNTIPLSCGTKHTELESPCLSQWGCPPAARTDSEGAWFKYRAMALGVGGDGQSSGQFRGFMEMATCEDTLFGLFFLTLLTKTTYSNIPYTGTHLLPNGKGLAKPEFGWHALQEGLPLTQEEKPVFCVPQWGVPNELLRKPPLCPPTGVPPHSPWCLRGKPEKAVMSGKQTQHQSPGTNSAPQWVDYLLCQIHSNRSLSMGKHLC